MLLYRTRFLGDAFFSICEIHAHKEAQRDICKNLINLTLPIFRGSLVECENKHSMEELTASTLRE
jgi:hypothetical protein